MILTDLIEEFRLEVLNRFCIRDPFESLKRAFTLLLPFKQMYNTKCQQEGHKITGRKTDKTSAES